mmetsp:Transcript_70292/g.198349  ORF Transcript_70292/g.198349 Transcript_70292/m.198349 type:complete len:387 (-) Transcript_70292:39-1199(-)
MTAIEVAEITLHEVVKRLTSLACACRSVDVPQKWVGSSLGLSFDCARPRPRGAVGEAAARQAVQVNLFDWGRSDFNTVRQHNELSQEDQHDRAYFWQNYIGGVDRLAWEVVRTYWHRFCNDGAWAPTFEVLVYDFDSITGDDFLGKQDLQLRPTGGPRTVELATTSGALGCVSRAAQLTYSVEHCTLPAGARLKESWRITMHKAVGLPIADEIARKSDPYLVVKATSADGRFCFRQRSSVKVGCLDPVWEETFDLAIAAAPSQLPELLRGAAGAVGHPRSSSSSLPSSSMSNSMGGLLSTAAASSAGPAPAQPPARFPVAGAGRDEESVSEWVTYLNTVAGSSAGHARSRGGSPMAGWGVAAKPLSDPLGMLSAGFSAMFGVSPKK